MRIEALAGRSRCRPGFVDEPLLAGRPAVGRPRGASQLRIGATLRPPRPARARAAVARAARPARARQTRDHAATRRRGARAAAHRPVRATASGGETSGAARPHAADGRRGDRDRRPAPAHRGLAGLAHPLAEPRQAGPIMERKLVAEADARPLVVLDPRGAATQDALDSRGARRGARWCVHFAQRAGCACCCPATAAPSTSSPTSPAGRPRTSASPCCARTTARR